MISTISDVFTWFSENATTGFGIILIIAGIIFTISELRVYLKHNSPPDQLLFWFNVFIAGIVTVIFQDIVFGLLLGISVIMIVETIKMWDAPVWGQLMAATTASYLVILFGKIGQIAYDLIVKPEEPDERIFSFAFNISIFVFIGVAFFFFGRKFILVSRLSSPQIIYLFLFGLMYGVLVFLSSRGILFERDDNGFTQSYNYLNISGNWPDRVMFANFGTFEALAVLMLCMYIISGWLLDVLFGIKPVTDPAILQKVRDIAKNMGIKQKIKVGFVKAPILNAFAYGPFFDKRIAFMASDIESFSDSDIRGIVGHELAHSSKNHIIYLLLLSVFELAVKKGLAFPATTLDYTFNSDETVQNISFGQYYFVSYLFLIVLLIFVRVLEGHADKIAKDAGYGEDLAKSLFRLEGFYNGVASDFGISVNLLTDRQYSIHEKRRFTAQAGRNLFNEVLTPSRGSAFANIFQSHPRSSYRITSLIREDYNPVKGAFFPYRLLGFRKRKAAVKELNENYVAVAKLIDETYLEDFGQEAIDDVIRFNPLSETYDALVGKKVIAYDNFEKKIFVGEFTNLISTDLVTSPFSCKINGEDVNLSKTIVREYELNQKYFLRDGSIVEVVGYMTDKEKGLMIELKSNGSSDTTEIQKLGKPISFLTNLEGKEALVFDNGISKLMKIDEINLGNSWGESEIQINGDVYRGKNLIVDFPPLGVEIRKEKLDEQFSFPE